MISKIEFEHGEKTCDGCRFAKQFGFMQQRIVCQYFELTLEQDALGVKRCAQCLEKFGGEQWETVPWNPLLQFQCFHSPLGCQKQRIDCNHRNL